MQCSNDRSNPTARRGQAIAPTMDELCRPVRNIVGAMACPQYISKKRPSRFVIPSLRSRASSEWSEGSLSGERSFAPLRMTILNRLRLTRKTSYSPGIAHFMVLGAPQEHGLFEMYCGLSSPSWLYFIFDPDRGSSLHPTYIFHFTHHVVQCLRNQFGGAILVVAPFSL